jgi:hypothetical protein
VERAVSKGKAIFPVRIENIAPSRSLELFVMSSQWVEAWQPDVDIKLNQLAQALLTVKQKMVLTQTTSGNTPSSPTISAAPADSNSEIIFRSLAEAAWADGNLSDSEKQHLTKKAKELGIQMARAKEILVGTKPTGATIENKPSPPVSSVSTYAHLAAPPTQETSSQLLQSLETVDNHLKKNRASTWSYGNSIFSGWLAIVIGGAGIYCGVWLGKTYFLWGWIVGGMLILFCALFAMNGIQFAIGLRYIMKCPKCGRTDATLSRDGRYACKSCGNFT